MPTSTLNSKLFWNLIDRWGIDDPTALRLIGREGSLTKKGTRPRFALDEAQSRRTNGLVAIERMLLEMDCKPAAWVSRKNREQPFGGQKPIEFMAAGGMEAIDAARRFVEKMTHRASL